MTVSLTTNSQPLGQRSSQGACQPVHNQAAIAPNTVAIAAHQVSMVFQSGSQSYPALQQVSLTVRRGDVHLLMGPSGSGKTTLLSILGGILTPTSGSIEVLGRNVTNLSRRQLAEFRLRHIGFIFQGFNLFPALTALENVEVAVRAKGQSGRSLRKEALALLEQVGLTEQARRQPRHLSGGQKQRVAIARALAGNPPIIMADEPTAALDSQSGFAIISLLRRLARESHATVLMVTHDPRIRSVADQIHHLEDGRIKP